MSSSIRNNQNEKRDWRDTRRAKVTRYDGTFIVVVSRQIEKSIKTPTIYDRLCNNDVMSYSCVIYMVNNH